MPHQACEWSDGLGQHQLTQTAVGSSRSQGAPGGPRRESRRGAILALCAAVMLALVGAILFHEGASPDAQPRGEPTSAPNAVPQGQGEAMEAVGRVDQRQPANPGIDRTAIRITLEDGITPAFGATLDLQFDAKLCGPRILAQSDGTWQVPSADRWDTLIAHLPGYRVAVVRREEVRLNHAIPLIPSPCLRLQLSERSAAWTRDFYFEAAAVCGADSLASRLAARGSSGIGAMMRWDGASALDVPVSTPEPVDLCVTAYLQRAKGKTWAVARKSVQVVVPWDKPIVIVDFGEVAFSGYGDFTARVEVNGLPGASEAPVEALIYGPYLQPVAVRQRSTLVYQGFEGPDAAPLVTRLECVPYGWYRVEVCRAGAGMHDIGWQEFSGQAGLTWKGPGVMTQAHVSVAPEGASWPAEIRIRDVDGSPVGGGTVGSGDEVLSCPVVPGKRYIVDAMAPESRCVRPRAMIITEPTRIILSEWETAYQVRFLRGRAAIDDPSVLCWGEVKDEGTQVTLRGVAEAGLADFGPFKLAAGVYSLRWVTPKGGSAPLSLRVPEALTGPLPVVW